MAARSFKARGASYDPSVMVETGQVIVVAINYRLGALGWLADTALAGGAITSAASAATPTG